jgi:predicted extracellular nuclease
VVAIALVLATIGLAAGSSPAPTAIPLSGAYGPQDFNALTGGVAPQPWPAGWQVNEQGTGAAANGVYTLGTGSSNAGDTYAFGSSSADRALGTLRSGTVVPYIGAKFTNTTGAAITSLDVSYRGEQWRLGTTGRGADHLDFQYSLNADDPFTGDWTNAHSLDFYSVNVTAAAGALDGNANSATVNGRVDGVSIPAGATFWLRWFDVDASGSDDGLGVDDVTVTPHSGPVNAPVAASCGANMTAFQGTTTTHQVSAADPDGTIGSFSLDRVVPAATGITISGNTVSVAGTTAVGTYTAIVRATNTDTPAQSDVCSFNITVTTAPVAVAIGSVQGSLDDTADPATFESPRKGQNVTVRGVVTELTYEQSSSGAAQNGFFLQDAGDGDPNSSDGVYVFTGANRTIGSYTPAAGDEIFLTAAVDEFFGLTELKAPFTVSPISSGNSVAPVVVPYPADARWWERHEGMQATIPAQSIVTAPTHLFASTQDTEFYVVPPGSSVAQRSNPYAQRTFRDAHPLDGSADKILVTDEGIKASDHTAQLTPTHTFQKLTAPITGGVYFAFSKYSVSANAQPSVVDGVDPAQNDPAVAIDRSSGFSIANFNVENLYDFRDDPTDGCDFTGNAGCPGVSPPFDYVPASDAEYQGRSQEIAHQIVSDLHSPDVIMIAEAEDQDICSVANGALACDNQPDGKPDTIEELALHVQEAGGPVYDTAFDRNGADARGIVCAFMFRSDRVSLLPAAAGDAVLGANPTVDYRAPALAYNTDVSNPKALNAQLPADVVAAGDTDGTNVFTRAAQVAHFRIAPTTAPGHASDVWVVANHFSSGPDSRVKQRTEQAAYNAVIVKAIQGQEANAKIVVGGDLNVYPRPDDPLSPPSDQLKALYDAGLHNLYDTVLAQDPAAAYSYTFDGNAQDLDHQFVSQSLYDTLKSVHEAHINADWPRVPGSNRGTSDHDPMVSEWALQLAVPPVAHANGPYAVDEGGTVALHATSTDADALDTATYAWDLDANGTYETAGQDVTFHAGDGPATKSASVRVTDSFGLTSTDTATITVRNVAPTATLSAPSASTVGVPFTVALTSPHDVSAADEAAGFVYAFDCGAGYGAFGPSSSTSCTNVAGGPLTVRATIRDKDGGAREYTATLDVEVTFEAVCGLAAQYATLKQAADTVCNDLERAASFAEKGRHTKQVDDAIDAAARDVEKWGDRGGFTAEQQATLLALLGKL